MNFKKGIIIKKSKKKKKEKSKKKESVLEENINLMFIGSQKYQQLGVF